MNIELILKILNIFDRENTIHLVNDFISEIKHRDWPQLHLIICCKVTAFRKSKII